MPWHDLGTRGCLCHSPTMVEVGARLGMQQGDPALQGRGAAVPAVAAARPRAIGGGQRAGIYLDLWPVS